VSQAAAPLVEKKRSADRLDVTAALTIRTP
jgi:hypothetical protein